jgi:uncharacterized membrane protein
MKSSDSRSPSPSGIVEIIVSFVLRSGVILSAAVLCVGLVLFIIKGNISNAPRIDAAIPYPRDLKALLSGILSLDPASVITLGLLVLIATPFTRVAVSIVAFWIERDWRYVVVTALVLTILILGIVVGR